MIGGGCDQNGEGRDGCGRAWCQKCYPEVKVNDLCSKCGKPPHIGQGCKLGPITPEEIEKAKSEPHFTPMCDRGPDLAYGPLIDPKHENAIKQYSVESQLPFDHETSDCLKATTPRTTTYETIVAQIKAEREPCSEVDARGTHWPLTPGGVCSGCGAVIPGGRPVEVDPLHKDEGFLYVGSLHHTMHDLLEECLKVQRTKGHDYTSGSDDRLANFRRAAEKAGITIKQAWFVYFFKHLTAIETYISHGQVESEPIRGRILDCINYLLLLELIREEEAIPKT